MTDDTLRDQVAKAIRGRLFRGDAITSVTVGRDTSYPESLADSLMPPIRDHIAAAVHAERERAIELIAQRRREHITRGADDRHTAGMYEAMQILDREATR